MIDALLFSVRDNIRAQSFGYSSPNYCELTGPDGRPPPRVGNFFVSVYELASSNTATRNLDEKFSFGLTLTQRIAAGSVPRDRIGDQAIASKLARVSGKGNPSFNARCEQLRAYLHMNWTITVMTSQTPNSANDNLSQWAPAGLATTYGFVEPARFAGQDRPQLVYAEWFEAANPESSEMGLKAELRFADARRLQPQTAAVGPYL